MFFEWGELAHIWGRYWACEKVNFGPLFIFTPLRGQTPDLTLERYSPGGPEKKGFKIVNFGPLYILTSLGGPTPDLTREHYCPRALRKMGSKL